MQDFEFHNPDTLDEALAVMKEYGEDARPISGGTALVVLMKQSLVYAEHLVNLRRIPGLSSITLEDGHLRIGALTTHRELETSSVVAEHLPFLSEIYSRVATVRIRNVATVGGGLAHADPSQDPPPGLMTLGASVRLVSVSGDRTVPVEHLFEDYYETAIKPEEILTELIVPLLPVGSRSVYAKFLPRTVDDYATVGVAVTALLDGGTVQELSVALGAVGATPIQAGAVETALVGQSSTAANIAEAAREVANLVDPLDDFRGSAQYKTDMAVVFTRRALESALGLNG